MSLQKSKIPVSLGQRSWRDLGAPSIGTQDFGRMDVLYHTRVNAGETINLSGNGVIQSAPMVVNTFGAFKYDIRAFFVPYRLLTHTPREDSTNFIWDYFEQNLSKTSTPYLTLGDINNFARKTDSQYVGTSNSYYTSWNQQYDFRRLLSQLRFPRYSYNEDLGSVDSRRDEKVSPFPFMAYQAIWWDYYRNSTLLAEQDRSLYLPLPVPGVNYGIQNRNYNWFMPRYCCWNKDYFTNARSNTTSGNYALGSVLGDGSAVSRPINTSSPSLFSFYNTNNVQSRSQSATAGGDVIYPSSSGSTSVIPAAWIRSALALDNYLQRMGLAGTRIKDRMFARFGIKSEYERLNQCYYLGGASQTFSVGDYASFTDTASVVTNTNAFNISASPNGMLSGQRSGKIDISVNLPETNFHSKETGILMIIGTLVPATGYTQGLNKDLTVGTASDVNEARYEFLTPELANLGLQPINFREIFSDGSAQSGFFGFTERYGDYGFQPAVVDGDMILSSSSVGMDSFHLFREFSTTPKLTYEFVSIPPSTRLQLDRIFQIVDAGKFSSEIDEYKCLDHFTRFFTFDCKINRAMASSWLPELYEDNNHGNTVQMEIGGQLMN